MPEGLSVSVVIPTLNGLLQSDSVLFSLERQSYLSDIAEVIIVDDASRNPRKTTLYESMKKRFSRLNIVVLYHERNAGPAAARNTGVKMATGDVIFFTDDDCELPSNCIEEHLKVYGTHPFVSGVGGWYRPYEKDILKSLIQTYMGVIHYGNYYGKFLFRPSASRSPIESMLPAVNTANLSVRRYVFNQVLFDEDFMAPCLEDVFFSESLRRAGYILYYSPLFVFHRKKLTLRGFIRLARSRGMGHFIYYWKYGVVDPRRSDGVILKYDLIRRLSVTVPFIRKRKLSLFFLAYLWHFLGSSSIMKYYYRHAYFGRMGQYPRVVSIR